MPISDLDGRYRPQRLGIVRLGRTEEKKIKGKIVKIPYATPYFVMDDMPEAIRKEYGPEPTTLRIEFLFNSIHDVFPHFHQYYLRRGLRCLGDGEMVLYRAAGTAKEPFVCIRDAVIATDLPEELLEQWLQEYGTTDPEGNSFQCLGLDCPLSEPGKCRPRGRLLFAMRGHAALGYHQMGTGSINAIAGIVGQFMLAHSIFGHITAIPWNLHLRPETVQVEGKSRKIYVPWIEIDPPWFQRHFQPDIRARHLRAADDRKRADIADLYGDDDIEDLAHEQTPQALIEAAREEEEEVAPTPAQEPVEQAQAVLEEATQPEEPPESPPSVAAPEGEPPDGPEVVTKKGSLYERLLQDANHNLEKRGYKARYEGVEEIRQAMEAGGVKGRLLFNNYLDYLTIVLAAKETTK